jgi:hypothetical protein
VTVLLLVGTCADYADASGCRIIRSNSPLPILRVRLAGRFGFGEGLAHDDAVDRREQRVAMDLAGGVRVYLLIKFRFRRYFRQATTSRLPLLCALFPYRATLIETRTYRRPCYGSNYPLFFVRHFHGKVTFVRS